MQCFYHNNREASVICKGCGRGLCSECGSHFNPPICTDCASAEAEVTKSTMIKSIGLSFALMIVGIIIARNPLGALLAGIPSGWRFLNKITPSMFIWLPLIGWVIYLIIKLCLSFCIGLIAMPIELVRDISTLRYAKMAQDYAYSLHN